MKPRNDRSRSNGALSASELESYLERGYSLASRRFLAEAWQVDAEADAEHLQAALLDADRVSARVEALDADQRAVVAHIVAAGGRARGENLRRDLMLKGVEGASEILKELVATGLVVPIPNPAEGDLDIETLLEHNKHLQRELALPQPALRLVEPEAARADEGSGRYEGEVHERVEGSIEALELNLLHLSSLLLHETLRLNKSGAPNRRSLARFARGISLPESPGEAADDLDLNDPLQLDYLSYLLALALELGLIRQTDFRIQGDEKAVEKFFTAPVQRRNRRLADAFRALKYWSEVTSCDISAGREDAAQQTSQFEPTGEPFIGARGYVMSVLKRSPIEGWVSVSHVVGLGRSVDPDYLPHVLEKFDISAESYLRASITRGLAWLGAVDVGRAEGKELVRFNARGAAILGKQAGPEEPSGDEGCMVVQPNLEIMAFLDPAPLEVLFRLYQISDRRKLSDRVATFVLTAESVQRGYSQGLDAESVIAFLSRYSHSPVPESLKFQLNDWERVHQRLTIYADGLLVRHTDPEALDLMVGQLRHENRDHAQFINLGPTSIFVTDPAPRGLERFLERNDGIQIDYLGAIPAALYFVDPLVVMVDPVQSDIVTWHELRRIAREDEDSPRETRFFELDIDLIRQRWPEDTLRRVVDFLEPRCEGGLPASQYLLLRSHLVQPPRAQLRQDTVVLVLENEEVTDIFLRVEEAEGLVVERLGPRALEVEREAVEELQSLLDELGVRVVRNLSS